ncbi:MAG: DUF3604 domain-containing protein [Deltaproteobacteria bacterium]|jgi:hypothetical protein|nr:DUF3604 domain-containing protein [Deltaproteobacteria bacterium]
MQFATLLRIAFVLVIIPALAGARSAGEPDRESGKPNPLKNVYFGEEHMHTRNSFDAFTIGVNMTWDDAYRYARGEEIKLSTTGERMKKRTPYDFVAITDHAEYFGVLKEFGNPNSPLADSDFARGIVAGQTDPKAGGPFFKQLLASLFANEPIPEYATPELSISMWQSFLETADKHYEPGKFTTIYGYEWTSIPRGANMHRNVFFKNKAAPFTYSAFDSVLPEDLWTHLEGLRQQGIDVFAIPHNSNVSNGWMFSENEFQGGPMNSRYARRQAANEPLFEIVQTKGQSDAHPALSPNDEFAGFELFNNLINLPIQADKSRGAFFRQGLATGMYLEKELGYNPYKMGVVAGADFHSGYQGNEEFAYLGGHGFIDDTPQKRLNPTPGLSGGVTAELSSAGTTAVWAEENTREGIWNAMMSKETYGTSGTMIRLRFFGGWDYSKKLVEDKNFVKKAYQGGVPMGQDLPKKDGKAPTFAVWALKDPESGNLDRIQIVKVWANPANGLPMEKIHDVAWSDDRVPDPNTGKLPPVGNTVDVKTAKYTNDIGDTQLSAVWTDPDFDPELRAAYYVRVLEIPTPRWSTYDSVKNNLPVPEGIPLTLQERAWSSPIWYTPAE